jgi:glycosyltransferase involved in cell wall biosynthesis
MLVTVAICTWNRAKLLDQTLAEMQKLVIPTGVEWELLVVNNNCTDETKDVIRRHVGELPLKELLETKQGQSHSRNHAIDAAKGEILIWTDDDVLVDRLWLAEYVEASRRWPEAAFFGGRIQPWFESRPPGWVTANISVLEPMLVIRDFGGAEEPIRKGFPLGANMAFRRQTLTDLRFDPRVGLRGNDQIRGDEALMFDTLRQRGLWGVWVPTASIRHFVVRERLTQRYVWKYYVGAGRTAVKANMLPLPLEGKQWLHAPRYFYRLCAERRARAAAKWLTGTTAWVEDYSRAAWIWGAITELRQRATDDASLPQCN